MTRMLLSSEHTLQEMEQAGSISAVRCISQLTFMDSYSTSLESQPTLLEFPSTSVPNLSPFSPAVDLTASAMHGPRLLSLQGCETDDTPNVQVCVRR